MKFAHLADCHLGAWRQPELNHLSLEIFSRAIDTCIKEKVDFVLIVGDLFDTAMPSIDSLKTAAEKFRQLKEQSIECFIIQGSHDYSLSGKSMISVLEKAGLCMDLTNLEEHGRTIIKKIGNEKIFLAGIAGKKGSLEQQEILEMKPYFMELSNKIQMLKKQEPLTTILLLHSTVSELLSSELSNVHMKSISLNDLPQGFDYYALGHIHNPAVYESNNMLAAYTGELFPSNFSEMESAQFGNFLIIEKNSDKIMSSNIRQMSLNTNNVVPLLIDANNESPASLLDKILHELRKYNLKDSIIALRIYGILASGKPSEFDFNYIEQFARENGAYSILKNTFQLSSKEFEQFLELKEHDKSIEELEEESLLASIKENIISGAEKEKILKLIKIFDRDKDESETTFVFSSRLSKDVFNLLNLEGENDN